MLDVFAALLPVAGRPAPTDDFFLLGGNSLLAGGSRRSCASGWGPRRAARPRRGPDGARSGHPARRGGDRTRRGGDSA
ncbi:hypothetical protein NKH77_07520 [Streptomyces sp. M19]